MVCANYSLIIHVWTIREQSVNGIKNFERENKKFNLLNVHIWTICRTKCKLKIYIQKSFTKNIISTHKMLYTNYSLIIHTWTIREQSVNEDKKDFQKIFWERKKSIYQLFSNCSYMNI